MLQKRQYRPDRLNMHNGGENRHNLLEGQDAGRITCYSHTVCCQPGYYSRDLNYREIYTTRRDSVHRYAAMFYEVFPKKSEVSIPVIPDGCVDVVLAFQNGSCRGISVCGTISTLYSMEFQKSDYIFGIRFLPGRFSPGIMGDITSFMDEQCDFKLNSREWRFIDAMRRSTDFLQRVELAKKYIAVLCDMDEYKEKMVQHAMQMIGSSGGSVGIEMLCRELIYSPRYIERIFKEYTGFSPKKMCRLVRARGAVTMLLRDRDLTKTMVAQECGYADLSHMNRELKSVLGIAPDMIGNADFCLKAAGASPTVYNF